MTKRVSLAQAESVAFLLVLAGCAAPAAVEAPRAGDKIAEVRTLKVGDTWGFRPAVGSEYTIRVVAVSDSGYITEDTRRRGVRFHRDHNGVATKLDGDPQALAGVDPRLIVGWKFLDLPMWPGKQFSYRVEGSIAWFSMEMKAVKWERVTVPAGSFEALAIDACYLNESSRWYGCGQAWWYAPDVKTFVKRRTPADWARSLVEGDFELLKFTSGGQ